METFKTVCPKCGRRGAHKRPKNKDHTGSRLVCRACAFSGPTNAFVAPDSPEQGRDGDELTQKRPPTNRLH